jgi:uncharacterized protein
VIVDAILTLIVLGPVVGLASGQAHRSRGNFNFNLHGAAAVIWILLALGYWIVCEHLWGQTVGKRLFSIRVESRGGGNPSWLESTTRNLFRFVDAFPYVIPYLLGFLAAKSDDCSRRLGDMVAGTHVAQIT